MDAILVTGATGNIGRRVVDQLRATGRPIRALTRRPELAGLPPGVDVVQGDLSAPETLDTGLAGAAAVFLMWLGPLDGAAATVDRIAAHAKRVVLLTSPHTINHPFFQQPNPLRLVHAGIEDLVQGSGVQWTILRPGVFALNSLSWWAPQIRSGDVVRWFHAGAATAPIHEDDIAAVAVRALCDDGHDGKQYVLTGPESLIQREQVEIIGRALGRGLSFEELTPQSARLQMLADGFPPFAADMLLNAYAAAVGLPAFVTSTVAVVTGARARTFQQWALDHAADFLA
jgi:uncharacterized protein YbjT (DUF2867 family)